MAAPTAEDLFRLHPKIRMVGLTSDKGEVAFLEMRPGVKSLAPEEENRAFMQLNALLVLGACERLSKWGGPVSNITVGYEKVLMHLAKFGKDILLLTVEKDEALEAIPEIVKATKSLMTKLGD
jgi:hypothetical protein